MEVRKEDFPVVIQAFDTSGATDIFIAEQIVNSQADVDTFTSRYQGKLIKARKLTDAERNRQPAAAPRRKSSAGTYILIIILLILVALVVVGFTTGWIQQTFGIGMVPPGESIMLSA